jgi:hypothetical protein
VEEAWDQQKSASGNEFPAAFPFENTDASTGTFHPWAQFDFGSGEGLIGYVVLDFRVCWLDHSMIVFCGVIVVLFDPLDLALNRAAAWWSRDMRRDTQKFGTT